MADEDKNTAKNINSSNTSKINNNTTLIIVAIIGAVATIIAAYIGANSRTKLPPSEEVNPTIQPSQEIKNVTSENTLTSTKGECIDDDRSKIGDGKIIATVLIAKLSDDCSIVSEREHIEIKWTVLQADTYFLWIFVYSPFSKQYYTHLCSPNPLKDEGIIECQVTFSAYEPYEIVTVLADKNANAILLTQNAFSELNLPDGAEEKDSKFVYRSP